jgi:hypothetical protein
VPKKRRHRRCCGRSIRWSSRVRRERERERGNEKIRERQRRKMEKSRGEERRERYKNPLIWL